MRLAFVMASLVHGGAERQTIALANRLHQRGHDCHVLYIQDDASQLERIDPRIPVAALHAKRYLDPGAFSRLRAAVSRIAPDVLVACNQYPLAYARLAVARVPILASLHCTKLVYAKEHVQMLAYRPLYWTADALVFVSEVQRRYWRRRAVVGRHNEVIPNGIDVAHWSPSRDMLARAALGLADDDYVIGLCAILRPEKNAVSLVDAIATLRARGVPAKGLLIGDGPQREAVTARARRLGVAQHVLITGYQIDVRPFVASCDVMAVPSHTEALALAAMESMAMGKPVVHSDVGGARELITCGRDGYVFPAGNRERLVEHLLRLADPALRRRVGANARSTVEARFSEALMVDRYESLLTRLASARGARPLLAAERSV